MKSKNYRKKQTLHYYFSVEGESEKLYFELLQHTMISFVEEESDIVVNKV